MRIRKLAKSFNNTASDAEQPTQKRIKTAAMGGSYLDSACRTVCTFIALTAFFKNILSPKQLVKGLRENRAEF